MLDIPRKLRHLRFRLEDSRKKVRPFISIHWRTRTSSSYVQGLAFRNNAVRTALHLPRIEKASPREAEKNGVPITEEMIEKMDVNELVQVRSCSYRCLDFDPVFASSMHLACIHSLSPTGRVHVL
jgi:hypothetical protein